MDQSLQGPTGGGPVDWRGLCAELADALDHNRQCLLDDRSLTHPLADKARAALAQPEPEVVGPTDEELLRMAAEAIDPYDTIGIGEYEAETECAVEVYGSELIAFARAVLARYSHQPAPPAEGEVGKLSDHELGCTFDADYFIENAAARNLNRAADLLEQRHPTPVPVAERLPSASHVYFEFVISDADDCTQAGGIAPTYAQALSEGQHYLAQYQQDGPHTLELRRVEVLPSDALPLLPEDAHVIEPTKHTILVPVPAPVPVSERLPGPGDCAPWPGEPNAGRWCWMASCVDNGWAWEQRTLGFLASFPQDFTHWLPATALPLPAGEVEE